MVYTSCGELTAMSSFREISLFSREGLEKTFSGVVHGEYSMWIFNNSEYEAMILVDEDRERLVPEYGARAQMSPFSHKGSAEVSKARGKPCRLQRIVLPAGTRDLIRVQSSTPSLTVAIWLSHLDRYCVLWMSRKFSHFSEVLISPAFIDSQLHHPHRHLEIDVVKAWKTFHDVTTSSDADENGTKLSLVPRDGAASTSSWFCSCAEPQITLD